MTDIFVGRKVMIEIVKHSKVTKRWHKMNNELKLTGQSRQPHFGEDGQRGWSRMGLPHNRTGESKRGRSPSVLG